jgi:hypothetical protein
MMSYLLEIQETAGRIFIHLLVSAPLRHKISSACAAAMRPKVAVTGVAVP